MDDTKHTKSEIEEMVDSNLEIEKLKQGVASEEWLASKLDLASALIFLAGIPLSILMGVYDASRIVMGIMVVAVLTLSAGLCGLGIILSKGAGILMHRLEGLKSKKEEEG